MPGPQRTDVPLTVYDNYAAADISLAKDIYHLGMLIDGNIAALLCLCQQFPSDFLARDILVEQNPRTGMPPFSGKCQLTILPLELHAISK